ncbi:MAG: hypothetical protein KGJ24_16145, partial [Burkholderiales bacterium]|nr:hypothetical protein [Burkholderiales bacterium]
AAARADGVLRIGLYLADFHRAWPWSERRWQFVGRRMAELAPRRWHGDARAVGAALRGARSVRCVAEPHLAPWWAPGLGRWAQAEAEPALFPAVAQRCDSFSQWWARATRGLATADELLSRAASAAAPVPHPPEALP